jgi:AcrR family transcriptional regulator
VRTRQRIMAATAQLLRERPLADVRVSDVARVADVAQPNFYTYFASVEDVILALGHEINADHLASFINDYDWTGADGMVGPRKLIEASLEFWREYGALFSIIGHLADRRRGDFAPLRSRQMRSVYKSFERRIRESQAAGRISPKVQPRLASYECIGILGSVGGAYELLTGSGFSHDQMVETTARLLHMIAVGDGAQAAT